MGVYDQALAKALSTGDHSGLDKLFKSRAWVGDPLELLMPDRRVMDDTPAMVQQNQKDKQRLNIQEQDAQKKAEESEEEASEEIDQRLLTKKSFSLDEMDLEKAHIKAHFRRNAKTGKLEWIKDYDDSRHAHEVAAIFEKGDKAVVNKPGSKHHGKTVHVSSYTDKYNKVRTVVPGTTYQTDFDPDHLERVKPEPKPEPKPEEKKLPPSDGFKVGDRIIYRGNPGKIVKVESDGCVNIDLDNGEKWFNCLPFKVQKEDSKPEEKKSVSANMAVGGFKVGDRITYRGKSGQITAVKPDKGVVNVKLDGGGEMFNSPPSRFKKEEIKPPAQKKMEIVKPKESTLLKPEDKSEKKTVDDSARDKAFAEWHQAVKEAKEIREISRSAKEYDQADQEVYKAFMRTVPFMTEQEYSEHRQKILSKLVTGPLRKNKDLFKAVEEGAAYIPFDLLYELQRSGARIKFVKGTGRSSFSNVTRDATVFEDQSNKKPLKFTIAHEMAHAVDNLFSKGETTGFRWKENSARFPGHSLEAEAKSLKEEFSALHNGDKGQKGTYSNGDGQFWLDNWINNYEGRIYPGKGQGVEWWAKNIEYHFASRGKGDSEKAKKRYPKLTAFIEKNFGPNKRLFGKW